ncbi:hypothetical protein BD324DRAFT_614850 [Kockovaella imperatae]|uniref:Ricin B lectin domain-containing protein n=1 Tax=Kockovaella imperatae TaxID=4999 RepID=A0A1Y1UP05_9TREE|nr:hypothetical protein BD324DRAFT_614850 [Kockovaella imperatae]ORX39749.1 hypothetical protein BD324DRAFT_614850 [Kockovaella imperatae]
MFTAALLMLAPLAAMASPIARTDATSQRIVLKSNTKQCVTAYGLAPQAGDILAIAPCEEPANQYYLHQFFLTEGIDSTAPVQLASTNLCIDAGSDAPSEYTSLTLQECNGSKQQSWYWFGASELEINSKFLARSCRESWLTRHSIS